MAYRIAVATTNNIDIDIHFGSASKLLILEVNDTDNYKVLEMRKVKEDISPCNRDCSGQSKVCGSGCGGNGSNHAAMEQVVGRITDCRCVLCSKCGPKAERVLERNAITVFAVETTIQDAIEKIISYYTKVDHHISLRKEK